MPISFNIPWQVQQTLISHFIQYLDDTVMILPAVPGKIGQVNNLLKHYAAQTGLKINYAKYMLIPLNVNPQTLNIILSELGCKQGSFSFTYLGLPLSDHRLRVEDFNPICQKIERRLSGCSSMLSYDGKLLLARAVFSTLPIFFMSTMALPISTIEK